MRIMFGIFNSGSKDGLVFEIYIINEIEFSAKSYGKRSGMSGIDFAVIVLYFLIVLGIGVYFSRYDS